MIVNKHQKVKAVLFLPKACVIAESVGVWSLLSVDLEGKPLRLFMSVLKNSDLLMIEPKMQTNWTKPSEGK